MTLFDEREHAFETKFVHDAELNFRIQARRNRLLGEWAGQVLGQDVASAHDYALGLVHEEVDHPGDDASLAKVISDLRGHVDADTVRSKMAEFMVQAHDEIYAQDEANAQED